MVPEVDHPCWKGNWEDGEGSRQRSVVRGQTNPPLPPTPTLPPGSVVSDRFVLVLLLELVLDPRPSSQEATKGTEVPNPSIHFHHRGHGVTQRSDHEPQKTAEIAKAFIREHSFPFGIPFALKPSHQDFTATD
jgi:hypothetical protein